MEQYKCTATTEEFQDGLNNICFPNLSVPNVISKPLSTQPIMGTPHRPLCDPGCRVNITKPWTSAPYLSSCPGELCNLHTHSDAFTPLLPTLSILIPFSHLWECCCHLDTLLSIWLPKSPLTSHIKHLYFIPALQNVWETSKKCPELPELWPASTRMATAQLLTDTWQCLRKHSAQLSSTQQFHDKVASELITALLFYGSKIY